MKQIDFYQKLDKLRMENWKVDGIMTANDNDFQKIPEFQQKIFLKYMGIGEVVLEKRLQA